MAHRKKRWRIGLVVLVTISLFVCPLAAGGAQRGLVLARAGWASRSGMGLIVVLVVIASLRRQSWDGFG